MEAWRMKGRTRSGLIVALFLAGVASTAPFADEGHGTDHAAGGGHRQTIGNTQCPVMPEEAVDPAIYTDYKGRRVFFCCAKCRRQFVENPESYLDSLSLLAATPRQNVTPGAGSPATPSAPANNPTASAAGPSTGAGSTPSHDHATRDEEPDHEHDLATGHTTAGGLRRFTAYLGKLHPLAVHFPIGILGAAALAELMAVVRHKDTYGKIGRFCVIVGALAALVTAALGWAAGGYGHYTGDLGTVLEYHRWTGTATAALAVGTAALAVVGKPSDSRRGIRAAYRVLLALTVATLTAAGHLGATLIYGVGHLLW